MDSERDPVRDAFQKVRNEIDSIEQEIYDIRRDIYEIRHGMGEIYEILSEIKEKTLKKDQIQNQTHNAQNSAVSTHPSTHNLPLEALKPQNQAISTGNRGVSTDRQTDRQTDTSTGNEGVFSQKNAKNAEIMAKTTPIDDAIQMLDSLDSIKKEIRIKFKMLTDQEILVFSAIYQLEEEHGQVDYKLVADKLGLTESSIRDYVGRLLKKDIPIEKKRINNKQIRLSIAPNLKKIATLPTILELREL